MIIVCLFQKNYVYNNYYENYVNNNYYVNVVISAAETDN